MKALNCKEGSAWHSWQIEGHEWARDNQESDKVKAAKAAREQL